MLRVYGRANSINVRKVLWMLDEVGVKYEREDWGRGFKSTDDPVFRKINPVGVVPVIDDGDFRLRESNTIVRYLAEKHGRADLYPKDLELRATTDSHWKRDSPVMISSTIPSVKWSWSGSSLMFSKGRTAMDGCSAASGTGSAAV